MNHQQITTTTAAPMSANFMLDSPPRPLQRPINKSGSTDSTDGSTAMDTDTTNLHSAFQLQAYQRRSKAADLADFLGPEKTTSLSMSSMTAAAASSSADSPLAETFQIFMEAGLRTGSSQQALLPPSLAAEIARIHMFQQKQQTESTDTTSAHERRRRLHHKKSMAKKAKKSFIAKMA